MVSKPHTKTYTTYNGSATDFLFPIKPNLLRLLGFHQPRVSLRDSSLLISAGFAEAFPDQALHRLVQSLWM